MEAECWLQHICKNLRFCFSRPINKCRFQEKANYRNCKQHLRIGRNWQKVDLKKEVNVCKYSQCETTNSNDSDDKNEKKTHIQNPQIFLKKWSGKNVYTKKKEEAKTKY